jgi:hypothetical protein
MDAPHGASEGACVDAALVADAVVGHRVDQIQLCRDRQMVSVRLASRHGLAVRRMQKRAQKDSRNDGSAVRPDTTEARHTVNARAAEATQNEERRGKVRGHAKIGPIHPCRARGRRRSSSGSAARTRAPAQSKHKGGTDQSGLRGDWRHRRTFDDNESVEGWLTTGATPASSKSRTHHTTRQENAGIRRRQKAATR